MKINKEKQFVNTENLFFYIFFFIITSLMLYRALFGIEATDEAYYMAEGRTVLEGNLPYALNNSRAVGMTFIMFPFILLFKLFSPEYEGFFIFMRLGFVIFKSILIFASFFLLRKKIGLYCSACGVFTMAAYHMYSIQNFSYNTISTMLIFFIGILLFVIKDYEVEIIKRYCYYLAGVLSAFAVFAHPAHSFTIILFLILFFIFHHRFLYIIAYILGGITLIILLFIYVVANSGIKQLLLGLEDLLTTSLGSSNTIITSTITLKDVLHRLVANGFRLFAILFLGFMISYIVLMYLCNKKKNSDSYAVSFAIHNIIYSLGISSFTGLCYTLLFTNTQSIVINIGYIASFVIIILAFIFIREEAFWFIGTPPVLFSCLEAFCFRYSDPYPRFIHAVPAFVVFFILYDYISIKKSESIKTYILPLLVALAIVVCELSGLRYVYRDAPLKELTYKVERGIYKGLFTTEQRGKDSVQFEKYIKELTKNDELISFRDNVPVGYLVMNGKICDIRTWDCLQYNYGSNNPSSLYFYYERFGNIPDKIIYVDLGIDDHLSIYEDNFLYNTFVKEHYDLLSEVDLNTTYKKIVIYKKRI